jgi:hypothetical protein
MSLESRDDMGVGEGDGDVVAGAVGDPGIVVATSDE